MTTSYVEQIINYLGAANGGFTRTEVVTTDVEKCSCCSGRPSSDPRFWQFGISFTGFRITSDLKPKFID